MGIRRAARIKIQKKDVKAAAVSSAAQAGLVEQAPPRGKREARLVAMFSNHFQSLAAKDPSLTNPEERFFEKEVRVSKTPEHRQIRVLFDRFFDSVADSEKIDRISYNCCGDRMRSMERFRVPCEDGILLEVERTAEATADSPLQTKELFLRLVDKESGLPMVYEEKYSFGRGKNSYMLHNAQFSKNPRSNIQSILDAGKGALLSGGIEEGSFLPVNDSKYEMLREALTGAGRLNTPES